MTLHKLTIDISTKAGWCLLLNDSAKPKDEQRPVGQRLFYGTWDLTRDRDGNKCTRRGQYYLNLWDSISQMRRHHGIEEEDIEIVIEAEAYSAARTEASAQLAGGWLATLEIMCERRALLYPRTVTTSSWRKAFIGVIKAPKEIKDTNERRKWIKDKVMEECHRRGLKPVDDNCADAIGILFWLVTGGKVHQEAKRAAKKAKSLEKRRQQKMNFKVAA
ncbi:hypothetical protein [Brucella anthropi]|uniref:hypothetical protein n=1 Tax=Brucella anthropi TaxID=529 RepID=UPI00124ECC35|nr:hypothetical protein [Brucella anthropi]KAB2728234.1 hypothetical protein F9K76_01935 [Brucella anthropi]KAB2745406.1 hypothetical protein F9K74_01885 [Brucella anthropi]KAB2805830.1 hypothetical protein F9K83_01885 [Brucella anthropi]